MLPLAAVDSRCRRSHRFFHFITIPNRAFNHTSCGGQGSKPYAAFATPEEVGNTCFAGSRKAECDWNINAGAIWDQRLKQFLLNNGVAVIEANPYVTDVWDTGDAWWNGWTDHSGHVNGGRDKGFLPALFNSIEEGEFGPIDTSRTFFHGFSAGAQMVSWMFEVSTAKRQPAFCCVGVRS